ncbi:MAG: hypothetical protein EOP49_11360 [Sphingobacteriales bacterium]|nr:MAG: hypothetical protein EOP49_11360 [Sphingobacteriales bacterium]
MKHLYVDGQEQEFQFQFFKASKRGEECLCLVKSRLMDYPIVMGKQEDESWTCISAMPVIIACVQEDLSRAIIEYKILQREG